MAKVVKNQMGKHHQCFLCSSTNISALPSYEQVGLVRCLDCSFVFMQQIPTQQELNAHYKTYTYDKARTLTSMTIASYNKTLDQFEPYRKTNRILDVGCGVGHFLQIAKKRGWDVYGTEFSETAVKIASDNGIKMQKGPLNPENYAPESFDVITSFEVIEHINNPNNEIKKIKTLLAPKGLFYCTTPNFNSILRYWFKARYKVIEYPEHLSYYTKKTLSKVITNQGFKKLRFVSTGISINQIKAATAAPKPDFDFKTSSDEKLRKKIQNNFFLGVIKNLINKALTLTNTGMILKGTFIKK